MRIYNHYLCTGNCMVILYVKSSYLGKSAKQPIMKKTSNYNDCKDLLYTPLSVKECNDYL